MKTVEKEIRNASKADFAAFFHNLFLEMYVGLSLLVSFLLIPVQGPLVDARRMMFRLKVGSCQNIHHVQMLAAAP